MRVALVLALATAMALTLAAHSAPTIEAKHFSHLAHTGRTDVTECQKCHGVDSAGLPSLPGANGHAPCLASACHAQDFISTGETTKTKEPARYAKSTAFCLGCHPSAAGTPPPPWQKPPAVNLRHTPDSAGEYHVELNHFEHTKRTNCRQCHSVDKTSLALVKGAPGHAQCAGCHNANAFPDFTLRECALCHSRPARKEYLPESRPKIDVRACDSDGHLALAAKKKKAPKDVPCFRHERTEHRERAGAMLECGECHAVVAKGQFNGNRYVSVKDLHVAPIIDNAIDLAHRSCGKVGCHPDDVNDSKGTARCQLCHADKTRSIFK